MYISAHRFKFEAHSINKASVVLYDKSHLYRNVLKHIHATFAGSNIKPTLVVLFYILFLFGFL